MSYFVGTGILLRLIVRSDPLHPAIRQSFRSAVRRGDQFYTACQNIAECRNLLTRPATARGGKGFSPGAAGRKIRSLERMFVLLFETRSSYMRWKEELTRLEIKGSKEHDARLIGVMRAPGLRRILTLNKADFVRFDGIEVVDPTREFPSRKETPS